MADISTWTPVENWANDASWKKDHMDQFLNDATNGLKTYVNSTINDAIADKQNAATISGAWTFSGGVDLNSGVTIKRTTSGAGNYTALITDVYVAKTGISGGGDTVTLPAAASAGEGLILIIKDEAGSAGTDNITVDGNSSETIDGSTTSVISTNYGKLMLVCDGSNWFSI